LLDGKVPCLQSGCRHPIFSQFGRLEAPRLPLLPGKIGNEAAALFCIRALVAPLFVLARQGRAFEVIAFVFMFATIFLLLLESVRPKLRLRKRPLPLPTIRLNIDGPST
jgi:hypothetical protein